MKKLVLPACIPILLFSCKKNDPGTPTSNGTILTSIRVEDYSGTNVSTLDSFYFDNSGRIVQMVHWDYDVAPSHAFYDSMTYKFTYNGSGNRPVSYTNTLFYASDNNESYTEDHTLSYDNQGRLIFDTSLAVYPTGSVARESYFKYTDGYTVINQSIAHKDVTDTIFINNGNVAKFSAYADSLGTGNFDFGYRYSYAAIPNPLYNAATSTSIGALLYVRTYYLDFISTYVPSASKDIFYASDLTYSYTVNAQGLPAKGQAKDRTTGELEESITYTYK